MKTERITVSLPVELIERIDRVERNRSRFIAQAVEHELALRRRGGLLRSLKNPHPEVAELDEIGVHAGAARLPIDVGGLVDLTTGTPVRWVAGQGWIEEPM